MHSHVLFFNQVDRSSLPFVGGKGANLGELSKAGFPVPGGFCVTTYAYKDFIATSPKMDSLFDELNAMNPNDLDQLRKVGERIRTHLQQLEIPSRLKSEMIYAWESVGKTYAYAVRSSATAEDLPTASFAGQQDTYLNIKGQEELLQHIQKCWASLFTDRAISYRSKNGFDHRQVYLSVVVQRMVNPEISGILFTADPVNGNRNVVSIDASFGLGEAIVSGMVSADLYRVKAGQIIHKNISEKKVAVFSLTEGGTQKKDLPPSQQTKQALTDSQIFGLADLGKRIEKHFGSPQDIEFCIENGKIFVVQSRPITSLYPLPAIPREPLRVMLSFGHVQMMTDPIKPLGISVLQTVFPKHIFLEAGGRLFIDPTEVLRTKLGRKIFPRVVHQLIDEATGRAISEVIQRPEFRQVPPKPGLVKSARRFMTPIIKEVWRNLWKRDPKLAKSKVESYMQKKWTEIREALQRVNGARRLEAIQHELSILGKDVSRNLFPYPVCFPISFILLKRLLGDDKELHQLNKSLPGNITSEMGLQIGDLADLVRELPEVEEYLKHASDRTFYKGLANVSGGERFKQAFEDFISKYGMRCPGEIDLTRPRWRETPTQLVPAILGHMRSVKPGEHRQKFIHGEQEARKAARRMMDHVGHHGFKSKRVKRLIEVYRYFGGLREHHKYLFTLILDECKKAIMAEADKLVNKGVLLQAEDVFFFTLDELIQLLKGEFKQDVSSFVACRKEKYEWHQALKPPRLMTSEGEIVTGSAGKEKFPEGALVGSPVSAGIVEGKARIVLKPEEAHLNEGEILVAPHTDPGWTPLFQSAKALVTEVGGLMTHGSVVAREYGIPAVVGVDDATQKIKNGQMIRVDGNQGFVEILSGESK
ncbi:phosphoenolpyruvate synthase [Paenactinomyces guangxiensis]|uniref:Rifampicin phosphotransferase n=1 Tax=Paenactinomyces guangxiensis TaxID=1490290 RepID=A0A7W1WP18_9BACL|nr:phosphoenolpyruvate synthase [Paenactinomyces guangxiensis]MBA4493416.1 phosphoenolpyruvate synthase [Paenactinomyces guangxiensis]MBH8590507.1 phosphoenolpyruvate synthase [Paenactinomyces guangxiensis]